MEIITLALIPAAVINAQCISRNNPYQVPTVPHLGRVSFQKDISAVTYSLDLLLLSSGFGAWQILCIIITIRHLIPELHKKSFSIQCISLPALNLTVNRWLSNQSPLKTNLSVVGNFILSLSN